MATITLDTIQDMLQCRYKNAPTTKPIVSERGQINQRLRRIDLTWQSISLPASNEKKKDYALTVATFRYRITYDVRRALISVTQWGGAIARSVLPARFAPGVRAPQKKDTFYAVRVWRKCVISRSIALLTKDGKVTVSVMFAEAIEFVVAHCAKNAWIAILTQTRLANISARLINSALIVRNSLLRVKAVAPTARRVTGNMVNALNYEKSHLVHVPNVAAGSERPTHMNVKRVKANRSNTPAHYASGYISTMETGALAAASPINISFLLITLITMGS